MKELSIEQKAKRYDEALEKIHQFIDGYSRREISKEELEGIFPELRENENENERIKNGLVKLLNCIAMKEYEDIFCITKEEALAWIENQCNKEPITCPICGWEIKKQDEQLQGKSALEAIKEEKVDNANKVEPKFNIDDWVVNKFGDVWHIDSFDKNNYQVSNGNKYNYFPISKQNEMHLWTIQNAKDGDVLVCKSDKMPFIFKGLLDKFHPDCPVAYCGLSEGNTFEISTGNGWWTDEEVLPATKEQIEQLMKVITDEGYEWNPEKKELKRVKDEPENHKRWIGSYMTNSVKDHIEQNPTDEEMKRLLQTEYEKGRADTLAEMQNSWSDEDTNMLGSVLSTLGICSHNPDIPADVREIHKKEEAWLTELYNRIIPQPKQEWSEEDELYIRELESLVKRVWVIAEHQNDKDTIHKMSDLSFFLKTLKPQQKPVWSEDDDKKAERIIRLLQEAYDINCINGSIDWLKSLRPHDNIITDEELAQAKKEAYNDALDKIEYHNGEPTFDDGWDAAIWYLKKRNALH